MTPSLEKGEGRLEDSVRADLPIKLCRPGRLFQGRDNLRKYRSARFMSLII